MDSKLRQKHRNILKNFDKQYKNKDQDFSKLKNHINSQIEKKEFSRKRSTDCLYRTSNTSPVLLEFKQLRRQIHCQKPKKNMTRKLIDHNNHKFLSICSPNEELINLLKKEKKSANNYTKVMKEAHRSSSQTIVHEKFKTKRRGRENYSSILNNIDGSTGGKYSEKREEKMPIQHNGLLTNKRRIKEFTPVMQRENRIRNNRFSSVSRHYSTKNEQKLPEYTNLEEAKGRREKELHEFTPVRSYNNKVKNFTHAKRSVNLGKEEVKKLGKNSTLIMVSQSTDVKVINKGNPDNEDLREFKKKNKKESQNELDKLNDSDSVINMSNLPAIKLPVKKEFSKVRQRPENTRMLKISQPRFSNNSLNSKKSFTKAWAKKTEKRSMTKFEELMAFSFGNHKIPNINSKGVKHRVKFSLPIVKKATGGGAKVFPSGFIRVIFHQNKSILGQIVL
ncbi:unnamed protein product [Moneuplotes crassus]|uniref:Uncharacterized protein n=3 Tax=Euplotes crassus TaxID=5936 RepID=A0AAD1X735_EUPCR|nr:unnamed protein product [Moneuplotes crassus]